MRVVLPLKVLLWSEQHCSSILGPVSLCALKAFNTIVESGISRVKLKWFHRLDSGCLPSPIVNVIVTLKHIVSD